MYLASEIPVSINPISLFFGGDPMTTTSKLNTSAKIYEAQVSPAEVCTTIFTSPASERQEQRLKQIDALAMRVPKKPKPKDSWLNTVGKYSEDSPLVHVMEKGAKIREAKRIEEC